MTDRLIEPGDRVQDPLDGEPRTVSRVEGSSVFMADGGVMDRSECTEVLLPSEQAPEAPRSTYVCASCGEPGVLVNASAAWNDETQRWALHDTFDAAHCPTCERKTRAVKVAS